MAVPVGSVPRGTYARLALLRPPGPPVTPELLREGRAAYRDLCAPCHGVAGLGDGPVVEKGFPRPPPLALGLSAPAEVVAIVTAGRGAMPAMAEQVPPLDRWAIARFIEAAREGAPIADPVDNAR